MSEKCWKCGQVYTTGGCGCHDIYGPLPWQLDNLKDAEIARLKGEVERLNKLYNEWGFADAPCPKHSKPPILPSCGACRAEKAEEALAAAHKVIEGVREWMLESQFCSAPYCKKCVVKLEQLLEDK